MKTICPYQSNVICAYRENKPSGERIYHCADCNHYKSEKPDEIPLSVGLPAIGCLFATMLIIVGVLFGMSELIKWLRV